MFLHPIFLFVKAERGNREARRIYYYEKDSLFCGHSPVRCFMYYSYQNRQDIGRTGIIAVSYRC